MPAEGLAQIPHQKELYETAIARFEAESPSTCPPVTGSVTRSIVASLTVHSSQTRSKSCKERVTLGEVSLWSDISVSSCFSWDGFPGLYTKIRRAKPTHLKFVPVFGPLAEKEMKRGTGNGVSACFLLSGFKVQPGRSLTSSKRTGPALMHNFFMKACARSGLGTREVHYSLSGGCCLRFLCRETLR